MDDSLQRKLRRLGVVKGVQNLKPAAPVAPRPPAPPPASPLEPLPGTTVMTPQGAAWVWQQQYPADHSHGAYR
ncbi:MAG TPA: hypothetical protein P5211_06795, partial [Anaerolineae bacterium]|nr:hypothetical protein [Anaerolineae bacterium]